MDMFYEYWPFPHPVCMACSPPLRVRLYCLGRGWDYAMGRFGKLRGRQLLEMQLVQLTLGHSTLLSAPVNLSVQSMQPMGN